jgi:hypothetical protein
MRAFDFGSSNDMAQRSNLEADSDHRVLERLFVSWAIVTN